MKQGIKIKERVYVSGEVYYGNKWYRVATYGTIEEIRSKSMSVTLDSIDGDNNVCVTVNNKYIHGVYKSKLEAVMNKELHIWLNNIYPEVTLHDYQSVNRALKNGINIIHTTNTHFCSTVYITKGYKIFAHMLDDRCVEIVLGPTNINTNRDIQVSHNLEKLLLANEFGFATEL